LAKFQYVAKDTSGAETSNFLHAESAEAAADLLHRDGYIVLSIREVKEAVRGRVAGGASFLSPPVPSGAVALFTKQLASMLHAGLPLIRAIYSLAKEESNSTLSQVLVSVATDIEAGESLSGAMAKHPKAFTRIYTSMVKSGEESGTLDTIMEHLVKYMNRTEAIKRKVKAALTYPIFVVSFAIIAFVVLLVRIVPMMARIYEKMGAELPGPTRMVIAASRLVSSNLWILLTVLAGLILVYQILKRSPGGRYFIDSVKIKLLIFGPILRQVVTAKYLRTFGVLIVSGLPVLDALDLAGAASGNEVIEKASHDIGDMVSRGSNLSTGFGMTGVFQETVVQMVATGEETGRLSDMLSSVSDHYDDRVETSIEGLSSIIEPLMIVLIGALIAVVLVAMFLPVFYLGSAIRKGYMH
jgi:type IV pilus assembly protein PilC